MLRNSYVSVGPWLHLRREIWILRWRFVLNLWFIQLSLTLHILQSIEQSQLIPLDGDIQTITRKMDEFKAMDPSITRNLGEILILTMNILHGIHGRIKNAAMGMDREEVRDSFNTFYGILPLCSTENHKNPQTCTNTDDICGHAKVQLVCRCIQPADKTGSYDCPLNRKWLIVSAPCSFRI